MSKNAAFYKKRWFQYGAISMLLIGFGISLVGEAIIMKSSGVQVMEWVALGTFALIVLNALSCTFGKSIACKVRERIPRF
jgi:hypothetical protein